ncbi:MAG: agglutinin biogenesis protein MshI [Methylophilaceae bacterium]
MRFFKKSGSQGLIALRSSGATGDTTTLAQLTRRENAKPLVNMAVTVSQSLNQQASLKALVHEFGLKKTRCAFILASKDYQLMQVEKPNVPQEEQKQAVRWKLKDMLDYPVEQATVDVVEIPADPGNSSRQRHVYAVAANNALIGEVSNRLVQGGVNLQVIDIAELAQRNIASLLEEPDRGLALLSFGSSGGLLTFTAGGELFHARRMEFDGKWSASAYERIALELQRSLDHFERQFPFVVINKFLLAPFSEQAAFGEYLRSYLYMPVAAFELSDIFEFAAGVVLDDAVQQALLLPVLGAALREEETT